MIERAIAIRHPWCWAVIHGGKDVENRTAPRQFKAAVGRRVFVHASKGMTQAEYQRAVEFMAGLSVRCPPLDELQFGGIVGSVVVERIVTRHRSRGSVGLRRSRSLTQGRNRSAPCVGGLGSSRSSHHDPHRDHPSRVRRDRRDPAAWRSVGYENATNERGEK